MDQTTHAPVFSLCYVEGPWAYFTTQKLSEQWGDDWDDAPYEHNAEEPYTFQAHHKAEGRAPWIIVKVGWDGNLVPPSDRHINSPWSVEAINAGGVAWLQTPCWHAGEKIVIPAGTSLDDFCLLVANADGHVYLAPTQPIASASDTIEEHTDNKPLPMDSNGFPAGTIKKDTTTNQ